MKALLLDTETASAISEFSRQYYDGLIPLNEGRNKMIDAIARFIYDQEILPMLYDTEEEPYIE